MTLKEADNWESVIESFDNSRLRSKNLNNLGDVSKFSRDIKRGREMCSPHRQQIAGEWWRRWSSKWTIWATKPCRCPRSWWGWGPQLGYQMPSSQRWLRCRRSPWLLHNKHTVPWTSSPSLAVPALPAPINFPKYQHSTETALECKQNWNTSNLNFRNYSVAKCCGNDGNGIEDPKNAILCIAR